MRISDWSSDVCSSDLPDRVAMQMILAVAGVHTHLVRRGLRSFASVNVRSAECLDTHYFAVLIGVGATTVNAYLAQEAIRSEEHTSELQSLMRISYAVFCLKKKNNPNRLQDKTNNNIDT